MAQAFKEALQKLLGLLGQDTAHYFYAVIQPFVLQEVHYRASRTQLGIIHGINQTRQASLDHCPGTHGAGLQCAVECHARQTPTAQRAGRFLQSQHLGVSCRIAPCFLAIVASAHYSSVTDSHRTHRHVTGFQGEFCLGQRLAHPMFVFPNLSHGLNARTYDLRQWCTLLFRLTHGKIIAKIGESDNTNTSQMKTRNRAVPRCADKRVGTLP